MQTPGGEAVDAVDEVDHVDDGDDPDHGQRVGEPAQFEAADEGQRQDVDPDAADHRDQRRGDLAEQLRQRRQVADVVDDADRGDRRARRAGSSASRRRPGSQIQPATSIRDEDRQPGEARHRAVVQAALLGRVDRADPEREPLGVGNQQPGDRGGGDEGEDGVGCRRVHMRVPRRGVRRGPG